MFTQVVIITPLLLKIVFFYNYSADDLASDLYLHKFPVQSIHGDRYSCVCVHVQSVEFDYSSVVYREQCDREQALEDFTTGQYIIVCV